MKEWQQQQGRRRLGDMGSASKGRVQGTRGNAVRDRHFFAGGGVQLLNLGEGLAGVGSCM